MDCTVRDMSESGCRLLVADTMAFPDCFELLTEIDAILVPCVVARRSAKELGVRFTGPGAPIAARREQIVADHSTKPSLRRRPVL